MTTEKPTLARECALDTDDAADVFRAVPGGRADADRLRVQLCGDAGRIAGARFGPGYAAGYAILPGHNITCIEWTDAALAAMRKRIMHDLTLTLEAIDHKNGWALLVASFDKITGGVWLAYVRRETLPTGISSRDWK